MSYGLQQWMTVGHVMGFTLWVGTMLATLVALRVHGAVAAGQGGNPLEVVERRYGMLMDIGATLAIVFGVILLLGVEPSPMKQPWMHVKLTAVLGMIGLHGLVRVKIKRARLGGAAAPPTFVLPTTLLVFATILVLVLVQPMAR